MSESWTLPHLPALQHQLVGMALLIWASLALWRARVYGIWWPRVAVSLVAMLGVGVVAGRMLAVASGDVSGAWWDPLQAGYTSFGLFVGAALALFAMSKIIGESVPRLLDVVVPGSLVALAIVRLGCLFRGCDFGGPAAWGIRHGPESPVSLIYPAQGDLMFSAVVHPLALYLSLAALVGAAVAVAASKPEVPGRSLLGAITYLVLRTVLETMRAPESAWHWLDVNANVILSVVAALVCAAWMKSFEHHENDLSGT